MIEGGGREGYTLSSHLYGGKKEYPPLSELPLNVPRKSVPRLSELHSFSPLVWWKFENVPHTLFSHHRGRKCQRVKVYPEGGERGREEREGGGRGRGKKGGRRERERGEVGGRREGGVGGKSGYQDDL